LGLTQSCGCLGLERLAEHRRGEANGSYKHGKTYSPEWNAWRAMIGRCRHPCSSSYDHYGAIGIDYCERWELFENFLADMGPMPDASYTLDRIDNDLRGGAAYCRGNCRWATRSEQAFNRRPRRPNATGFKGVTKRVTKKAGTYYVSAIEKDDRRHHFGPFSAPEPAYAAYLLAAGALYGVLPKDAAAFAAGLLSRGARDLPV